MLWKPQTKTTDAFTAAQHFAASTDPTIQGWITDRAPQPRGPLGAGPPGTGPTGFSGSGGPLTARYEVTVSSLNIREHERKKQKKSQGDLKYYE